MSSPKSRALGPLSSRLPVLAGLAAGAMLLAGCAEYSITVPDPLEAEDVRWATALGIRLADFDEQASGLWIRLDQAGEGDPAATGDALLVDYEGWLPSGQMFDSSTFSGPLSFRLGVDLLIPGFEEGVTGMRVDEVRTILIPPHLGYGPRSAGQIPPNSWLAFRVELVGRTVMGGNGG